MKAVGVIVGLLLAVSGLLQYLQSNEKQLSLSSQPSLGSIVEIRGSQLLDLDGSIVPLTINNRVLTIVNFWASWCAPCLIEIPSIIRLAKLMENDVHIIAISADESREEILSILKSYPEFKRKNISVVWDNDKSLTRLFKVNAFPESYIFGYRGEFKKKLLGSVEWTEEVVTGKRK